MRTVKVGRDGIALRDSASKQLLRTFPYAQIAAWRHTTDAFIFFAMPEGLSTQQVLDREKMQEWKLMTPEGAALGEACKTSMAELAKSQDNLDKFERLSRASTGSSKFLSKRMSTSGKGMCASPESSTSTTAS